MRGHSGTILWLVLYHVSSWLAGDGCFSCDWGIVWQLISCNFLCRGPPESRCTLEIWIEYMVGPLDNYVVKDFKAFWRCVGMVRCHHRLMSIYSTSDKASLQELDRLFSKSHFKISDADEIVSSCFGKRQSKWLQPFKSRETAFLIDSRWACAHLASASSETCENGLSTMVWQSASGVCSWFYGRLLELFFCGQWLHRSFCFKLSKW